MDREHNGKPYEQMDDLGGKPTIFGNHPYRDIGLPNGWFGIVFGFSLSRKKAEFQASSFQFGEKIGVFSFRK